MVSRYVCGSLLVLLTACSLDTSSTLAVASSGSAGTAPPSASDPSGLSVHVAQGELLGHVVDDGATHAVREFLGIPFAEPPVGTLRWAAPQAKAAWPQPLVAGRFGPRCPQAASHGAPNELESEDCLYLNVWAPPAAQHASVMVWIHGGGNRDGSASDYFTSGALLAARYGVVVVSLNYRLGVLGFLAHPELNAANQGLWDQQLALRWTHDNIAAFGGDPSRITIFGESAGSTDVCLHLAAPGSRGLFSRAIGESGGCTTRRPTLAFAKGATTQLAAQLGCAEDAGLACLRAATVPALFAASEAAAAPFGPVVDGSFTPEQPRALYDRGEIARVPLLIGSNSDEGTAFTLDASSIANDEQYVTALKRLAAEPAEVQLIYPLRDFESAKNPYQAAFARAWGDGRLVCSTLDVAVRAQRAGAPVYMYNFDMPMDDVLGAAHAFEIGFVFGTMPNPTPDQKAVSDRMQRYWTRFAETGDPNAPNEYPWPSFTQTANVRMSFAATPSVIPEFRTRECNFWRTQYDKAF